MKAGLLTALLLLISTAAAIDLEPGVNNFELSTSLRYVAVDPALSRDQVLALSSELFQPLAPLDNYGFSTQAFWFVGEIRNRTHPQSEWILLLEYPLLDHLDLYLETASGAVQQLTGGDREPFDRRYFAHRHFSFPVTVPAGETVKLALRVSSESSVQVPLRLVTPLALAEINYLGQLGMGLLYGVLLALAAYNLLLFLTLKDTTFLYYVLYVASFGLLQLSLNGLSFQFFWPGDPQVANLAILLMLPLAQMAMLQFCRSFLTLRTSAPRLDQVCLLLMVVLALISIAAFVVSYRYLVQVATGMVFVSAVAVLASGVRAWSQGYRPARYFLLAWGLLIAGMLAYAGVSFGFMPRTFVTTYGMQIGSAAEMVLLSFALAYRFRLLQEENRRMEAEARSEMEQRVGERTAELNDALTRLETANRVLEQSSQRDGLTGVYNRRHLDLSLTRLWAEAIDHGRPLTLIVVDLDQFKQVNDQRGHMAGDDCLRQVARAMEEQLLDYPGILARFGGEEFFVLLPDIAPDEIWPLAEGLRERIEMLKVVSEDQAFGVTASIGVASLRAGDGRTYRDLVRIADKAMYEAKRQGRNRVVATGDVPIPPNADEISDALP
ncbi:MAG: diguanylate cyclase [Pseudomonadota bacterium]